MSTDDHEPPTRARRVRRAVRSELGSALELSALVGFAVVQPILGPFGESPETFVSTNATGRDIVVFALLVALAPLAALVALGGLARLGGERVRAVVHLVLVALLAGAASVSIARGAGLATAGRVLVAVVVVAVAALAHHRWAPARLFLRYASPVPIALVVVFLFASPVAPLVRPASVDSEPSGGGDHPPVVFIVLDELSTLSFVDGNGRVDAGAFPNLARLADTSSWYRDHTSVSPATMASLPAITTGAQPATVGDERAPTHADHPDNIMTLFSRTHDVHAVEWATELCPGSLCGSADEEVDPEILELLDLPLAERPAAMGLLLAEARELWASQVWPTAPDYSADYALPGANAGDTATRVVLEFVSGIEAPEPGAPPGFHFLHAPLPHTPWTVLPSGRTYDGPDVPAGAEFLLIWPSGPDGQELAEAARSRHLLQLQWTDRLLGLTMDRLQDEGIWDDAIVVVTADHGVAFTEGHHMRIVDPATQVEIAWSPLFVKEPGQSTGAVLDHPVNALDIVPTVAELAGVDVDWDLDGRSLVGGPTDSDRVRPMVVADPDRFDRRIGGDRVDLDGDGLGAITSGPGLGEADDDLRLWRHGRNGALLGRTVAGVGVCAEPGPEVRVEIASGWDDLVAGTLAPEDPVPLWVEGTFSDDEAHDVVAAVDGVVAGSAVSHPGSVTDWDNPFAMVLAAPLVDGASGKPSFYEVVDGDGCRLQPLGSTSR